MIIHCFHGTDKKNECNISTHGLKPSIKETEYLGKGVYFFESASFSDGLQEAINFCKYVRKISQTDIIVYEADVQSEQVLDLVDNPDHRTEYDRIKQLFKLKAKWSPSSDDRMVDYRVFHILDKENKFEVIRALIDASRKDLELFSYIVKLPQIQVCVKSLETIRGTKIAWRPEVRSYKKWTTE
jgi:hypothetical protein